MENKESEFLTAIKEKDRLEKSDREEYDVKIKEFMLVVGSGEFKLQGEEDDR